MKAAVVRATTATMPGRTTWRPPPPGMHSSLPVTAISSAAPRGNVPGPSGQALKRRFSWRLSKEAPSHDGAHLLNFGNVVTQHVLDPRLEGHHGTGASGTGALQVQVDHPVLETLEDDVATRSEEHTSELQSLMRISY